MEMIDMPELISREELLNSSKDCPAYQEMVEELNKLLVESKGKAIQYNVKYTNLTELLVEDLVEKGYDVYPINSVSVLLIS